VSTWQIPDGEARGAQREPHLQDRYTSDRPPCFTKGDVVVRPHEPRWSATQAVIRDNLGGYRIRHPSFGTISPAFSDDRVTLSAIIDPMRGKPRRSRRTQEHGPRNRPSSIFVHSPESPGCTAGYAGITARRENVRPGSAWRRLKTIKLPQSNIRGESQAPRASAVSFTQAPTEATAREPYPRVIHA
jgi:hypothetical protein